jgi:hypothetical protein
MQVYNRDMQRCSKGGKLAFDTLIIDRPSCRRVHRPLAAGGDPSLHSSQNPGRESGETAPKPLTCIGLGTEAANPIFFVR